VVHRDQGRNARDQATPCRADISPSPSPLTPPASFPALPFHCLINIPPLHPIAIPTTPRVPYSLHTHTPPSSCTTLPSLQSPTILPVPISSLELASANNRANMPAVVSNATRIWELNIHWDLFSQCGVWDPKGRGVDIWECIRARTSTPVFRPSRPPRSPSATTPQTSPRLEHRSVAVPSHPPYFLMLI
jgi:hypothetical protein